MATAPGMRGPRSKVAIKEIKTGPIIPPHTAEDYVTEDGLSDYVIEDGSDTYTVEL